MSEPLRAPKLAERPRPSITAANTLFALGALGLLISSLPLALLLRSGAADISRQAYTVLSSLLFYLPFVALPVFFYVHRRRGMYECLRPNPISFFGALSVALLALVAVYFVNGLTLLWEILLQKLGLNIAASDSGVLIGSGRTGLLLSVLFVAVLPGVCEEFLFRGVILSAWEAHGTKTAVLVSAALFTLTHGSVLGAPAEFVLGMLIAAVAIYFDSIYASVIFHTVYNAALVIISYLQTTGETTLTAAEQTLQDSDLAAYLGGSQALVALTFEILFLGAMIALTLRGYRTRAGLRGVEFMPRKREKLTGGAIAALVLGLIIMGVFYGFDLYAML